MSCPGKIFLVTGLSGAGKTTLVNALLSKYGTSLNLSKVVTCTTRKPRESEEEGVDYFFLSHEQFKTKESAGEFLETNQFAGNLYGTPKLYLNKLKQGTNLICIVDINGLEKLKKLFSSSVKTILIKAPSTEELNKRLQLRDDKSVEQRVQKNLDDEITLKNVKFHHIIVADQQHQALAKLYNFLIAQPNPSAS